MRARERRFMPTIMRPWRCPTCLETVASAFCPGCGERPVSPPDFTLRGILAQMVKVVVGIDGRVVRSLRLLVTRPGALTEAYVEGRRKPFVGPFQLFFLANLAFFVVQSLTHTKIFSSPLESHLHRQDWSATAQALLARHLEATHDTIARFAPLFDQAVILNAKSLVILMVAPFALLLPIVFVGSRKPFAVHLAFALHLYAMLLLLFCGALGVVGVNVLVGGVGLESAALDNVLTTLNLIVCAIYLYVAAGRVYGGGPVLRAAKVAVLTLAIGAIVLGYRFAIFLITLYSTAAPQGAAVL
jgi:Protein of unknown function (DUF3667)